MSVSSGKTSDQKQRATHRMGALTLWISVTAISGNNLEPTSLAYIFCKLAFWWWVCSLENIPATVYRQQLKCN